MKDNTMRRACATTAITVMEGPRNHGIVLIKSSMQLECARIVILTTITKKKGKNKKIRRMGVQSSLKLKKK